MKIGRMIGWAGALAAALLAGCGGGEEPTAALQRQRDALVAGVTPEEAARQVMDYGENLLPGLFPGHETTRTLGAFRYRFYPATGIYLGVVVEGGTPFNTNGVYVMGGSFGMAPRYVGLLTQFVTPVQPSQYILDSFGQIVAGGADGVGTGDAGADGTAGDGAPIVGATVTVTDANGRSVSAVTDTVGHYRVKVTGFTPPFVARLTKPDGSKVYTSLNVAPTRTNAYVTMNISGLTDKISSDVARAGGRTRASELTPQIVAANTATIAQSVNELRTTLGNVISAAGINPTSFDPIGSAFRPDHTGYDFVLDNTVITTAADGSTQVAVSPTFTAYPGTWSLSLVMGADSVPLGSVPGSSIPTQQALQQATTSTFVQQYSTLYGSYTVSSNGNTIRVTGSNTDYTVTVNSFGFSGYQGCGACGVGSTVSYTMSMSITAGGTFEGQTQPTTTESSTLTFRYQRTS